MSNFNSIVHHCLGCVYCLFLKLVIVTPLLKLCNFLPTMLLRCAVLLFCVYFVRTSEVIHSGLSKDSTRDVDERFSMWPSVHNGVWLMRLRKREIEQAKPSSEATVKPISHSEQLTVQTPEKSHAETPLQSPVQLPEQATKQQADQQAEITPKSEPTQTPDDKSVSENKDTNNDNSDIKVTVNKTAQPALAPNGTLDKAETNATVAAPKINLSDPGVVKRAFIVFGGFALLGSAYYFVFYRKKNSNNDAKNTNSSIDPNQFRYGVLKSEDKMNNLELSRVPLTMESDEDEEEDLEIFDLGQKKKSLSYINLQQNDEDIVLNDTKSIDMENLLVDIEDKNSDTLINWSSTGSKSIL